MASIAQQITTIAQGVGLPAWIPLDIGIQESELQNKAPYFDAGSMAEGVFSTHAGYGGYTFGELANPTTNITAAIDQMLPAYQAGEAQGLSGSQLLDYVANNSGFPDQVGVAYANEVEPAYDQGLNRIYASNGGSTASSSTSSSSVVGSVSKAVQQTGDAWVKWAESMDEKMAINFSFTSPIKSITNDASAITLRFSFFILALVCFILAIGSLGFIGGGNAGEAAEAEEAVML